MVEAASQKFHDNACNGRLLSSRSYVQSYLSRNFQLNMSVTLRARSVRAVGLGWAGFGRT